MGNGVMAIGPQLPRPSSTLPPETIDLTFLMVGFLGQGRPSRPGSRSLPLTRSGPTAGPWMGLIGHIAIETQYTPALSATNARSSTCDRVCGEPYATGRQLYRLRPLYHLCARSS